MQKHKHLCKHQQNKDLKVSGLRPPTFNKLDNNNFGFIKPIYKFDNYLINELIMNKKNEHNI